MITNPNDRVTPALVADDVRANGDPPEGKGAPRIKVRQGYRYADPDALYDKLVQTVDGRILDVDAKLLVESRRGVRHVQHYSNLREMMRAPSVRRRVLDHISGTQLRDLNERMNQYVRSDKDMRAIVAKRDAALRELVESRKPATRAQIRKLREDAFTMGLYPDEATGNTRNLFPITDTVLPYVNSPYGKQQLFHDYMQTHQKAWEAATRNPIGKRIINILSSFVLGRGVVGSIKRADLQEEWDDYVLRNNLRWRTRQTFKELLIYGEVFLRYFRRPEGLVVRSLDPSTIWEIVTEPDDIESVIYYHQQYTLTNASMVPSVGWMPSKLIIRQIPGEDIDHHKINATSSEKRGRSELYAVLGWLLRFKEFMNDRILLNKMRAMFAVDVKVVGGDDADVQAAENQFATPPGPGAAMVHNDTIELEFLNVNSNAADAKADAEMILNVIALGSGVSAQFLGVNSAGTRAQALISTEPDVKNFEYYQELTEDILQGQAKRVFKKFPDTAKLLMEFTFPALAQEDRSAKLADLMKAEAMDWFSKRRVAHVAAREFQFSTFDYDREQAEIQKERGQNPVIAQGMQQVTKIAPDPTETPGLGKDLKPENSTANLSGEMSATDDPQRKVSYTSGEMGFSAKRLSGRGQPNTQATLNRSNFTRGGEKTAIRNNRTSGTPLRNSEAGVPPRPVWGEKARAKALEVRRQKKLERQRQALESNKEGGEEE